jgi:hypothetical protein
MLREAEKISQTCTARHPECDEQLEIRIAHYMAFLGVFCCLFENVYGLTKRNTY